YLPFELVDDILEQTRTVQRRLRDLPSRVGVYFLLALGMYPRLGYARVWAKLTAGLQGLPVASPSEKALRDLRRRLGPAPLTALAETGTRGLLGAALGSAADRDEATVARRLLHLLHPGMLILLDRAFDANAFLREVAATGALLLARAKSTRHPVVLGHLPDGSYLSQLSGLAVRVIG